MIRLKVSTMGSWPIVALKDSVVCRGWAMLRASIVLEVAGAAAYISVQALLVLALSAVQHGLRADVLKSFPGLLLVVLPFAAAAFAACPKAITPLGRSCLAKPSVWHLRGAQWQVKRTPLPPEFSAAT
jgi:hypothetical protein